MLVILKWNNYRFMASVFIILKLNLVVFLKFYDIYCPNMQYFETFSVYIY